MKITDYPVANTLNAADVLVSDGASGTRGVSASNALYQLIDAAGLYRMHRNFFRGKNLGTAVTAAQRTAIQNGTFLDLWVGDYWIISGRTYRIVDINYWLGRGDTKMTDNHLVIMPDSSLYQAAMNSSATTAGGYTGSQMYTSGLNSALTTIQSAFGSALKTHREYLPSAVASGKPSAGGFATVTIDLPTEKEISGGGQISIQSDGATVPATYSVGTSQLKLFDLVPQFMMDPTDLYWLRDIVSASYFGIITDTGTVAASTASNLRGVRPLFAIG